MTPQNEFPAFSVLKPDTPISCGAHTLCLSPRGKGILLISFSEAPQKRGKPDPADWAKRLADERSWSHLHVSAQDATWYRDPVLITFFERLTTDEKINEFDTVALCGISMGGFGALSFARFLPKSTVVALNPQSTLAPNIAPWDHRFEGTEHLDWQLPGSDAAQKLSGHSIWGFYDPFYHEDRLHMERLKGDHLTAIKCIGLRDNLAGNLMRMKLFDSTVVACLRNELNLDWFYERMRTRKNYYFYRKNMEAALTAKGQSQRAITVRDAYRARRRRIDQAQDPTRLETLAQRALPQNPGEWIRSQTSLPDWPSEPGNVWMLEHRGDSLRYLSNRWQGDVIGYEERNGITLAQTPPLVLGVVAMGHGMAIERPLLQRFPWHVTDASLDGSMPAFAALSEGTVVSQYAYAGHETLPGIMAITQSQSGIDVTEALPKGATYQALYDQIRTGVAALKPWGKRLFIDRIRLSLLAGAPHTGETEAARHYTHVATAWLQDIGALTGQQSAPFFTIVQSAGTRTEGQSEVILAEGRVDIENPALDAIVVTPSYPYALMSDTPATPTPDAALQMDELCALAVAERQAGRAWYCPSLQLAELRGSTITATFVTLSGLHLEDGFHGFTLEDEEGTVKITNVKVTSPKTVKIDCETAPQGEVTLCYAWGQTADGSQDQPANRGALRDQWECPGQMLPRTVLRRYALSGRVKVIRLK